MHGFIRHNIHSCPKSFKEVAYKSLFRPHLENGATVWDPYTQKDTHRLKMVERMSAFFVQSDYRHRSSVTRMLEGLNWESLKERCTICQLTMVFKILNREMAIPSKEFCEVWSAILPIILTDTDTLRTAPYVCYTCDACTRKCTTYVIHVSCF